MNLRDFERIETKLGLQTYDGKHHLAFFVYNGVTIARTMRSHGNSKYIPEHSIRKQLHLTSNEFSNLIGCTLNLEEYIKILAEKGFITKPEPS